MDVVDHNREAWNLYSREGGRWTLPVSPEEVAAARAGDLSGLVLTPIKPIPRGWLGDVAGADVLCLASGGGQQGPLLAASGARVTVLDMSEAQLESDREVAAREGLSITTVQSDMRDLSALEDATFDLIVHPVSNCFAPEIRPVWREAYRVLRPQGAILSGFNNPVIYCYPEDQDRAPTAELQHTIPYSDLDALSEEELEARIASGDAIEFGHSLSDQIGGQLEAGFLLAGFYEDHWSDGSRNRWFPPFIATRAIKPAR